MFAFPQFRAFCYLNLMAKILGFRVLARDVAKACFRPFLVDSAFHKYQLGLDPDRRSADEKCVLVSSWRSASGLCPIKFAIAAKVRFPPKLDIISFDL